LIGERTNKMKQRLQEWLKGSIIDNYKIFEPYKTVVTETITLSEGNFKEQGKIIKKQDKVIKEMQRFIDNRKDIIDSLGDN